ncbi:hypothetical protein ACLOJK_034702, partial [Asimina triloba]
MPVARHRSPSGRRPGTTEWYQSEVECKRPAAGTAAGGATVADRRAPGWHPPNHG